MVQTQNRILRKIEVAVRAWRRKRLVKRKTARYIGAVKKGNLRGLTEKSEQNHGLVLYKIMYTDRNFRFIQNVFVCRKLEILRFCPNKKFSVRKKRKKACFNRKFSFI